MGSRWPSCSSSRNAVLKSLAASSTPVVRACSRATPIGSTWSLTIGKPCRGGGPSRAAAAKALAASSAVLKQPSRRCS
eukprot:6183293-Pleurochrysis_carterae.AAC.1